MSESVAYANATAQKALNQLHLADMTGSNLTQVSSHFSPAVSTEVPKLSAVAKVAPVVVPQAKVTAKATKAATPAPPKHNLDQMGRMALDAQVSLDNVMA